MASYSVKYRLNAWVLLKIENGEEHILGLAPTLDKDKLVQDAMKYFGQDVPFSVYTDKDELVGIFNIKKPQ